MKKLNKPDKII